jgi:glycosyltransferase involved in cell wall biosynthesis
VLVEAMLCGVPVVATRIGAVPEIVEEGITGVLGDTVEHLPGRVADALSLDRAAIRARAEVRFNAARMARDHAEAYERIARAP